MKVTKSKVIGSFLGTAIGDALGMPVETFSQARIAEEYGRVTKYHVPDGHKWFKGEPAGMVTDDTQLTLAVAQAMIEEPFSMETQAAYHVAALREGTKGWGGSTKRAVRRLANGAPWHQSGEADAPFSGRGNGVAMKIAPVGLFLALNEQRDDIFDDGFEFICNLSKMTHQTSISASAALAQAVAVYFCATSRPEELGCSLSPFSSMPPRLSFITQVTSASETGRETYPETIGEDDLTDRLSALADFENYDTNRCVEEFGAGSCYCYNSIPFTLMHFLLNPTLEGLFDIISAGGDTDSNGAMFGALLGALHGQEVFPQELVSGLQNSESVFETAERFWEAFGN